MKWQNSYTKITLTGLNLERYINILRDNNIEIHDIHRDDYNSMSMYVWDKDIKYIRDNANGIDIQLQEHYGIRQWTKFLINRVGVVVGSILSIIMILVLNAYTLHFHIIGIENIKKETIIEALNTYGIYIGKISNYDNDGLNKYLLNCVEGISLVSTQKVGTTLVINIKEKTAELEEVVDNYYSPYNMVINDFEIYSGIGNKGKGDIVRKGDLLVYAQEYLDSDGVLHLIKPHAKYNVTIWHTGTHTIYKEETVFVRTGNSVAGYKYMLGNKTLINNEIVNMYQFYDAVEMYKKLSNSILPLEFTKTVYYETKPEIRKNDFDQLKEKTIANLRSLVYNEVSANEQIINEKVDIIQLEDRYIVNFYLECNKEIYIGE